MQITLNEDEIHEAVEAHVRAQISLAPNQKIGIKFTAGRGENGLSATLDIRTNPIVPSSPTYRAADLVTKADTPAVTSRNISATPDARKPPQETIDVEDLTADKSIAAAAEKAVRSKPVAKDEPAVEPEVTEDDATEAEAPAEEAEEKVVAAPKKKQSIFSKA